MGKKKDKAKHRHDAKHDAAPTPLAGIAAAIARQVGTPAGRQLIAGALVAAAGAIAGRDGGTTAAAPARPEPPVPPVPPRKDTTAAPPPSPAGAAHDPGFATPHFTIPPEAAKVIGLATSAFERWAQGLKPKA